MSDRKRKAQTPKQEKLHKIPVRVYQPITVLSDGILALLGYISAYLVAWKTFLASSGFVVLASAAAVGAIKFAGFTRLSSFHRFLTEFAGNVGIPAIFIGVYYREKTLEELRTSVIILMALIILYLMCEYVLKIKQYRTIVGLISVSVAVYESVVHLQISILIGAAFFVVAGLVIGDRGKLFGFRRVDLLHYALALGCVLVGYGITKLS